MEEWINPNQVHIDWRIQELKADRANEGSNMNCTNCNGVGMIIVADEDGNMTSIACPACQGSGNAPDNA